MDPVFFVGLAIIAAAVVVGPLAVRWVFGPGAAARTALVVAGIVAAFTALYLLGPR